MAILPLLGRDTESLAMQGELDITRDEALALLKTRHGIYGREVFLLELIPLVEMVWADGVNQPPEVGLVYEYALRRLAEREREAQGEDVPTAGQVNAFVERFISRQPNPATLRELRQLALLVIFDHSDPRVNDQRRRMILEYCLDIGAAAVSRYPYHAHERFSPDEKALLLELVEALQPSALAAAA